MAAQPAGSLGAQLSRLLGRIARRAVDRVLAPPSDRPAAPTHRPAGPGRTRGYAGDHHGPVRVEYEPRADGDADPGEVVWAWVPFEEDPTRGKDRPVLVVGRDRDALLGLMLTSQDHDRDAAQEARWGREWMDVGAGGWDPQRRPSEVRLDRVLRLDPAAVRREGAALDRDVFGRVAHRLNQLRG